MRLDLLYSQTLTSLREANYAESTLTNYRSVITNLQKFMDSAGIEEYSPEVGERFLPDLQSKVKNISAKRACSAVVCHLNKSLQGEPFQPPRKKRPANEVKNFQDYERYLSWCEGKYLARGTLKNYRNIVSQITNYFDTANIHSAGAITPKAIIGFCETLGGYEKGHKHNIIFVLRNSLAFFYEVGLTQKDLSPVVPIVRYDHASKLPSIYSEAELDHMLKSIDTSTPKGKRDYAMLLLVDCTGIRSSDATSLTFSSLDWNNDRIDIVPKKTGLNHQIFPLYPELGEAIMDYLFDGRPVCDKEFEDYIFLTDVPPYRKMHASTFASIVRQRFEAAGIDTSNRKAGPHAIRHSLATAMINKGKPITEIAKVLNHTSIQTTTIYAKVDISSLSKCPLDVPEYNEYTDFDIDERLGVPVVGRLAHHIADYVLYQRTLGKKALNEEKHLRNLSKFSLAYDLSVCPLPENMVRAWGQRRDTEKANTHHARMGILRMFAIYLTNLGYNVFIPDVPVFKQRWVTFSPHIYSDEELQSFFSAADTLSIGPTSNIYGRKRYLGTLFRLLLGCGMRIGEALSILPSDINFEANTIHIREAKNDKQRIVPMSQSLSKQLNEYITDNGIGRGINVFSKINGQPNSEETIYQWFRKILTKAGIEHNGKDYGPRVHDFRHTFAVLSLNKMLSSGIPFYSALPILKDYLGHSDITATEKYLHLAKWMYPDLVEKMNDISNQVIPETEVSR